MSFSADITKFAKKAGSSLDEAARAIKIELFTGVIKDTRVDTGRLRGNWQTTTGSPASGQLERFDQLEIGSGGGSAYDEAVAVPKGDTVDYLTNNLPYSEIREERDGMVARNMARLQRILKKVSLGVRN